MARLRSECPASSRQAVFAQGTHGMSSYCGQWKKPGPYQPAEAFSELTAGASCPRGTEDSSSNENFCFLLLLFVFKIVYAKSLNNQKHHFDDKAGEFCFTIQGKCMREHEV